MGRVDGGEKKESSSASATLGGGGAERSNQTKTKTKDLLDSNSRNVKCWKNLSRKQFSDGCDGFCCRAEKEGRFGGSFDDLH